MYYIIQLFVYYAIKKMRKNKEKMENLKESGVSETTIKLITNEDEHDLKEFKKNIINVFENRFPDTVVRRFEISTFEDLAKVAVEYYLLKQGATKVNDDEGDTRRLKAD